MRIFDVIIPATAAGLSILAVASFKITEEKSYEIRKELEARRGKTTVDQASA
jgi:Na+/melibiose symporter-like transporter